MLLSLLDLFPTSVEHKTEASSLNNQLFRIILTITTATYLVERVILIECQSVLYHFIPCCLGTVNIIYIFTNPSALVGYDARSFLKLSLTGLNSEFSFSQTSCLTKAEEPSLSYYLPIAGGTIIGFILFPRVLVLCEMQSVSSRI